ncbi:hypothetical protein SH449x_001934 [Pirellulaceae bacterium SH449]
MACTVLSALMAVGATMFIRIYRIGQDANYRSIALQEVANVLEERLQQSNEDRNEPTEERRPSESVLHRWPDAKFAYTEAQDELGTRVTVELILHSDPAAKTIQLSGWIVQEQRQTEGGA